MVYEDIIYNSTVGSAEQRICGLVTINRGDILCRDVLEKSKRVFAGNLDFAHMADVEQASGSTDSVVLTYNAGILNWHFPTTERDHPRTHCDVALVEQCSPKRVSCHSLNSFCCFWKP